MQQISQLHAAGWNDRQITDEVGLGFNTVWRIRREILGLPAIRTRVKVRSDCQLQDLRDEIIRLHGLHYSDADIGREIGRKREQVRDFRRKHLQLPSVDPQQRFGRERARRKQDVTLGRPLGEIRAESFWSYAPSLGWPTGVRYRAAQILELLCAHESLTGQQIAELLGVTPSVALKSNDPQGTYLGNLISRGLVAAASRVIETGQLCADGRTHKGKKVNLYFLTPAARDMKQAWLARRDVREELCSPPTEERLS